MNKYPRKWNILFLTKKKPQSALKKVNCNVNIHWHVTIPTVTLLPREVLPSSAVSFRHPALWVSAQAAQTHVAREGCNVIYIKIMWRAGVALQATVENIRVFVWEIYYWDLRTLNNAKPYFFLNEINKKDLPTMYSTAFWCLIVVLPVFLKWNE